MVVKKTLIDERDRKLKSLRSQIKDLRDYRRMYQEEVVRNNLLRAKNECLKNWIRRKFNFWVDCLEKNRTPILSTMIHDAADMLDMWRIK